MKSIVFWVFALLFSANSIGQTFTRKDSLRGGMRKERSCYDVQRYDLNLTIQPREKFLFGSNAITFLVQEKSSEIQLDLFDNMTIDSIIWNDQKLDYRREFNAVFVSFPKVLVPNTNPEILHFHYSGNPSIAKNAPWDGGFVFTKDRNNTDWIGVACQGFGASSWIPLKDSQTDEPDLGVTLKIAVPNGLTNVSNGRLTGTEDLKNGYTRWDWEVVNPINTYDITVNIGDYVAHHYTHNNLDISYYVLSYNKDKAIAHFEEVIPMMDCFQQKFGTYPFVEDGYKLVETPYLGMEHQSAVAYGNNYLKGYRGFDMSGTGIGLLFDYIVIHETGHEWFGNSITASDIADMWIHEGFTQYTEAVYLECRYGYEKAERYLNGLKRNIMNDKPIIGRYGLNNEGSGDMYPKGALLLHTLRGAINDDHKWWSLLFKFATHFRHKIINNADVIHFFNQQSGMDLTPIFREYLYYTDIPELQVYRKKNRLFYRWKTHENDFALPVELEYNGHKQRLFPTTKEKSIKLDSKVTDYKIATQKGYFKVP